MKLFVVHNISRISCTMEVLKDFDNADTVSINTLALEEMLLEEREKEMKNLHAMNKKVCYLHTSLLYYRNPSSKKGAVCYDAWRMLVKRVGGTPNTWRDLGCLLGLSPPDLDYIMHTVREDPVDTVLKVFMQDDKATLDKIVDSLIKLQRYDILTALEEPFDNLSQAFNINDSGYHSVTDGKREVISYTKNIANTLPPALCEKFILREKDPNKPNQLMRPPAKTDEKEEEHDGPTLFLTFVEDGLLTADNIKTYIETWTDFPGIKVITLTDKREEVYQNPEKFIREYFEKADFVVPIITSGYLQEIKSHSSSVPNTSDNLDSKYVNFIYNLIINHYIHASGCMNKKVRSVLPKNVNVDVLRSVTLYPDLMPWTFETNFDQQFKAFLKQKIEELQQ